MMRLAVDPRIGPSLGRMESLDVFGQAGTDLVQAFGESRLRSVSIFFLKSDPPNLISQNPSYCTVIMPPPVLLGTWGLCYVDG